MQYHATVKTLPAISSMVVYMHGWLITLATRRSRISFCYSQDELMIKNKAIGLKFLVAQILSLKQKCLWSKSGQQNLCTKCYCTCINYPSILNGIGWLYNHIYLIKCILECCYTYEYSLVVLLGSTTYTHINLANNHTVEHLYNACAVLQNDCALFGINTLGLP